MVSMMRKFRERLSCCSCEQCAKVEPKISMTSVWDKSTVCSCWQLTHAAVPVLLKSDGRWSATTPASKKQQSETPVQIVEPRFLTQVEVLEGRASLKHTEFFLSGH